MQLARGKHARYRGQQILIKSAPTPLIFSWLFACEGRLGTGRDHARRTRRMQPGAGVAQQPKARR
jgi:hypothetical protein